MPSSSGVRVLLSMFPYTENALIAAKNTLCETKGGKKAFTLEHTCNALVVMNVGWIPRREGVNSRGARDYSLQKVCVSEIG